MSSRQSSVGVEAVSHALATPWQTVVLLVGGGVCGYGVSWFIPRQYTTSATVVVNETPLPNSGALGSLVERIGGNLGIKAESPPFIASLFNSEAVQFPVFDVKLPTVVGLQETVPEHYGTFTRSRGFAEVQQRTLRKMRKRVDASIAWPIVWPRFSVRRTSCSNSSRSTTAAFRPTARAMIVSRSRVFVGETARARFCRKAKKRLSSAAAIFTTSARPLRNCRGGSVRRTSGSM